MSTTSLRLREKILKLPLTSSSSLLCRYDDASDKSSARLWVEYAVGAGRAPLCAPLEPRLGAGKLSALGYTRMSENEHLWRDIRSLENEKAIRTEKEAEVSTLIARLKAEAAACDEEMEQSIAKGSN